MSTYQIRQIYYLFIIFIKEFNVKPNNKLSFTCKECKNTYNECVGKVKNLNAHLNQHEKTKDWYRQYLKS